MFRLSCCAIACSSWIFASIGFAQQTETENDPFAGVEEMVVVGSGTAALLSPESTSAVAFDAGDLEAYGVEDLSDISAYVPNLEIRSQNATNASFFVRGVGLQDFGANASSAVPIFQDGIARNPSATQLVGLYDVGGLSVLKGPQGSGNFRNASAGVIIVKSTQPEPDFSGFAKVTLAQITSVDAHDADRYSFEAAMNIPVFDDIVSARISTRYSHENPFFENGCANRIAIDDRPVQQGGGQAVDTSICGESLRAGERSAVLPYLGKYLGEVDDYAFRGQIRIQPPDGIVDWTFRVEISNLNRDSTLGQHLGTGGTRGTLGAADTSNYRDPDIAAEASELEAAVRAANPGLRPREVRQRAAISLAKALRKRPLDKHPYRGDFDSPGRTLLETHTATMTGLFDLEDFDAELNFGFIDYRKSEIRDTDLSPNPRFPSNGDDQAWELYGDLTFEGESIVEIPIEWDAGLYSLVQKTEARLRQEVLNVTRVNEFTEEISSFGVFAQARYEFLEGFTLAAGVRYNWERKDFEVDNIRLGNSSTLLREASSNQRTWDAVTGFGEIRYALTEDIATYLKYSRGFKAGHFNPSKPTDAKIPGSGFADPEQIDAFEWGLDYGFWAGRITGNAAIFYYNYRNYQVFRLTTTASGVFRVIQNARQARNYGAELDITLTPLDGFVPEAIEGLQIIIRGGWLDTAYVEFTNAEQRIFPGGNIGVSIDYSGNSLINAPNLQLAATFTWPLLLGRLGTLTPQYDFTWTDDTPFDPNEGRGEVDAFGNSRFPAYLVGNRAYTLHNVRLTWEPPDESGLQVSGWCRNVTDQRFSTFAVDISTFSGQQLVFTGDPRICGADIRFSW